MPLTEICCVRKRSTDGADESAGWSRMCACKVFAMESHNAQRNLVTGLWDFLGNGDDIRNRGLEVWWFSKSE